MTTDEALAEIRKALNAAAPSREAEFRNVRTPEDLEFLGLDSIAMLDIVDRLERQLGISFSDDFLLTLKSARDLVNAIQEPKGR